MNCTAWEERIALFAGGDSTGDEMLAVRAHLEACRECARFAAEMREDLAALGDLADVPQPALAVVRAGVLARIAERSPGWFAWWKAAAAAAALSAVVLLWPGPVETLVVRAPAPPGAPEVRVAPRPAPQPLPDGRGSAPAGASIIKIYTDDPDVVILLVGSDGGME